MWHVAKYGNPYSEFVLCIYPIQSVHTQQWTHTHREHTLWAAIYAAAPGEQLGVWCLAQGHLSHGIEGGRERCTSGPCRDLWRGRCSKYKRGTWNTAFNRAVLLADMCIEVDASVLIQQQMPWRRFFFFLHLLITLEWYYYYCFCCCYCVYRVWWFCCGKHYCCCCRKNIPVLFKIEFYSNPVLNLFIFWMIMIIKTGLISIIRRKISISPVLW